MKSFRLFSPCLALVGLIISCASASGSSQPDWVKACLAEPLPPWVNAAAAVSLLRAEEIHYIAADRVQRQIRSVIRIGSEGARGSANLAYGYNPSTAKITSVHAWIISADGKKTEQCLSKAFVDGVAQYSNFFWSEERVMRCNVGDSIEVGGVFAWEIQAESQTGIFDSNFRFFGGLPAVRCTFEVTPSAGQKLLWFATSEQIPAPVPGAQPGAFRWEMKNLRYTASAFPNGFLPNPLRVSVRQVSSAAPDTAPTWDSLGRQLADVVEPRLEVTPELRTKAEALVAGKTSRWERVRALTEFVQKDVSYLFISLDKDCLAGYRPHAAGEVLRNRYGDCKDKATLLATMLRAVGDRGYVVLVYAQNPRAVIADWPSASFNHAIAAIPADSDTPASWPRVDAGTLGSMVLFDATDPATPLGALPTGDQAGTGLLIARDAPALVRLPSAEVQSVGIERHVKAILDGAGHLHIDADESYFGPTAAEIAYGRDSARKEGFTKTLEARVHECSASAHALHWTEDWDPLKTREHLAFDFEVDRYGRTVGADRLMFAPVVFGERTKLRPWATRQEGVVWLPAIRLQDETHFVLPPGVKIEETPDELAQAPDELSWKIKYLVEGANVTCRFEVSCPGGFINRAKYETYRTSLQQLQDALKRPVIVQLPPAKAL